MKTKNRTPKPTAPEPSDTESAETESGDTKSPDAEAPDAKPNKAKPPKTEPDDVEPSDAELSKAKPRKAKPLKTEPDTAGADKTSADKTSADNTGADNAEADNTGAGDADKPQKPNGRRTVALALTVVAALCAAWFGWSWYGAAHDESLHYSSARDEALHAGEQAIQNLNTLDYRSLDEGLKVWQDSSTSQLYREIVQGRPQFEQAVRKAQTITSAKVLDAAVTELDQHAGKASVLVALQVTVTPPKGEPTVKKTRLMGQLTRTSTGWKLSALAQAPVGSGG
ncbi:hypothetical protein [Actinomadura rugatobispora]|uniref:Mce-associated membrane protein n=1 Tax=Actinomadura rugatobispora TaxID=1994 RepID=A0ABW1A041_9ACTN